MKPFQPKPKACAHCGSSFTPLRSMQAVCSPICAARKVRSDKAASKVALKARKAALQTIPELIKLAQKDFNAYIRQRDEGQDCICCPGVPLGGPAVGGGFDCGHYRSVGSASHLRFDERNANGQRKQCNRYGAGRAVDYRIGLIRRIGLAAVEAIESNNAVHKWTADELREIRATYKRKLKELTQ